MVIICVGCLRMCCVHAGLHLYCSISHGGDDKAVAISKRAPVTSQDWLAFAVHEVSLSSELLHCNAACMIDSGQDS